MIISRIKFLPFLVIVFIMFFGFNCYNFHFSLLPFGQIKRKYLDILLIILNISINYWEEIQIIS